MPRSDFPQDAFQPSAPTNTGAERLRSLNAKIVVGAFTLVTIVLSWVFALAYLNREERLTVQYGIETAESHVRAVAEHAERTFQSADQAVLFYKYQTELQGVRFDLAHYLQTGVVLGDVFNLISIIDEHGLVSAASKPFEPVNLSDREHFKVHRDRDSHRLFISKPVLGRVSGKWSIQMTRRANKPDGSFLGVIVISMDPFYFTHFYRDIDPQGRTAFALVGDDGVVRARYAEGKETVGQTVGDSPTFKRVMAGPDSGHFEASSAIDGHARLYAYRRLADYPLFAMVGVDKAEVLAPFYRVRVMTLGGVTAFSIVCIVFAALMIALVARLERSRTEALAASRAKSDFLAAMSHELRTPLHGILGYAELLGEDQIEADQRAFVDAIRHSGEHLLNLVNGVLDIGRIEAGKMELVSAPIHLETVLRHVIQNHESSASLKGLSLTLETDAGLPAWINGDETRFEQVLNNLVHNAVKFTDRGSVRVRCRPTGESLVVEVIDTGVGIAPEHLRRIFEKFVQVNSSLSRTHEGSGLGLTLVQQLVNLMEGQIKVHSEPGHGTTFELSLPLRPIKAPIGPALEPA